MAFGVRPFFVCTRRVRPETLWQGGAGGRPLLRPEIATGAGPSGVSPRIHKNDTQTHTRTPTHRHSGIRCSCIVVVILMLLNCCELYYIVLTCALLGFQNARVLYNILFKSSVLYNIIYCEAYVNNNNNNIIVKYYNIVVIVRPAPNRTVLIMRLKRSCSRRRPSAHLWHFFFLVYNSTHCLFRPRPSSKFSGGVKVIFSVTRLRRVGGYNM